MNTYSAVFLSNHLELKGRVYTLTEFNFWGRPAINRCHGCDFHLLTRGCKLWEWGVDRKCLSYHGGAEVVYMEVTANE
jgi:hypothetical protein